MSKRLFALAISGAVMMTGCASSSNDGDAPAVSEAESGVNRYLWRASLDTFSFLPIVTADPYGGIIMYDWLSFEDAPDERVKATIFILDTRLRADGVKVSVFRQVRAEDGTWADAEVNGATPIQLENRILTRARNIKAGELS